MELCNYFQKNRLLWDIDFSSKRSIAICPSQNQRKTVLSLHKLKSYIFPSFQWTHPGGDVTYRTHQMLHFSGSGTLYSHILHFFLPIPWIFVMAKPFVPTFAVNPSIADMRKSGHVLIVGTCTWNGRTYYKTPMKKVAN